jgi:hypothetical protein
LKALNIMHAGNLIYIPLFAVLASCSNFKESTQTYGMPIAGAGIGVAVAGDSTKDKVIGATAGALGGGILSNLFFGKEHKAAHYNQGELAGYQRGLNDAAKRRYWDLQKNQNGLSEGSYTLQEVDIPPTNTTDGRILMPRRIQVPIME